MTPPPPPFLWSTGGASVPGASHLRRGVPNQDAFAGTAAQAPAPVAILALSDGHGSAAHSRSDVGSRLAVEAARRILSAALADPSAPLPDPAGLGRAIVAAWREAALAHLAEAPRHEGETAAEPLHLYGATLVAAAVHPAGVLLIQLGDGDILARRSDGAILRPLPCDADLVGDQTYSLCLPDAEAHLRATVLTDPGAIDLLMLSTDGLSKSFANEADFVRLAGTWGEAIGALGLPGVVEALPEWLAAASRRGSGDDMTLGFVLREGAALAAPLAADRPAEPDPSPAARLVRAAFDLLKTMGRAARQRRRAPAQPHAASHPLSEPGDLP